MVAGQGFWVRLAAAAAILFSSLFTCEVQAQDIPKTLTPLVVESDINDVNIANAKTQITGPVLSVPAAPNLRFDKVQNAAPYLLININTSSAVRSEAVSVHYGAENSSSFKCLDHECYDVSGRGSIMVTPNYFMLAPSGARYNFSNIYYKTGNEERRYASSIYYPNGESISITYNTGKYSPTHPMTIYRPSKISSSTGYYINLTYVANGSPAVEGWGVVSEAALFSNSDPVNPLGKLTFSGNNITDISGRTYQCVGCNSVFSTTSGQMILPGETTPQKTVSALPSNINVIGSVVRDGVTYTYSYQNLYQSGSTQVYDSVTVSGPNGFAETYRLSLDAVSNQNLLREKVDSIGRLSVYQRDAYKRVTKVTEPEGNSISLTYINGMVASKTLTPKPGSGLASLTEALGYNEACDVYLCWRPSWYRDAKGNQTDYIYNSDGLLVEQTEPADTSGVRRKTYVEYETTGLKRKKLVRVCGQGTTCGTNAEIRTEYEYFGNTELPTVVREVDLATGQILETRNSYDIAGRLLSVDKPRSDVDDITYYRYDILGRKTWEISPPSADGTRLAKRFTYRDSDDRVVAIENGSIPDATSSVLTVFDRTDMTYDARRNVVQQALSAGGQKQSVTDTSYDLFGRLECSAQRMNPAIYASLPASACSLGTEGAFGPDRITRNTYDTAGQLLKVQKAYGTALQEDYSAYTYSPNGKRTSLTDARGYRAEMTYDGHDRQTRWYFPSPTTPGIASTGDYEEYGYDANGNRTSLRKRDGSTIAYQYDALNRSIVKIVPQRAGLATTHTRDVHYGYDLRGLQTYARFDNALGEGLATSYDAFGRPTSSSLTMDGATRVLSYDHDKNGNRTELTWPDSIKTSYSYDGLDRMAVLFEGPRSLNVNLVAYGYNNRGLRDRQNGRYSQYATFSYDPAGRLNGLGHDFPGVANDVAFTYGYTPASQIAQQSRDNDTYAWTAHFNVDRNYTTNGLNQYTAAGAALFAYDGNGNLIGDGVRRYGYDVENRLVWVTLADWTPVANLRYDPLGRLYETVADSATTRFFHDGDELIAEYDGAGTLLRRYAHGKNVDDPVVWYEGSGLANPRWLHTDHQGSIVAVTDSSGGAAVAINSYDEYGIPKMSNLGRFQYTGQAWLPEIGMYYYKARIYSPTLGRFMQTDPIGYEDQVNLYAYVGNDAVNKTDPTGTEGCCYGPNGYHLPEMSAPSPSALGNAILVTSLVIDILNSPVSPTPDVSVLGAGARQALLRQEASGAANAVNALRLQKQLASESGLKQVMSGKGEVIAGTGSKQAFDGAAAYAKRYGGKPSDYTKVSSEGRAMKDGSSISVHAVRNIKTGDVYDPKTIVNEAAKVKPTQ